MHCNVTSGDAHWTILQWLRWAMKTGLSEKLGTAVVFNFLESKQRGNCVLIIWKCPHCLSACPEEHIEDSWPQGRDFGIHLGLRHPLLGHLFGRQALTSACRAHSIYPTEIWNPPNFSETQGFSIFQAVKSFRNSKTSHIKFSFQF